MSTAEREIRTKVRLVVADEDVFDVLSNTGKIAVALVLDRFDLLTDCSSSILEAIDRLGPEWTQAAIAVQRRGWDKV